MSYLLAAINGRSSMRQSRCLQGADDVLLLLCSRPVLIDQLWIGGRDSDAGDKRHSSQPTRMFHAPKRATFLQATNNMYFCGGGHPKCSLIPHHDHRVPTAF